MNRLKSTPEREGGKPKAIVLQQTYDRARAFSSTFGQFGKSLEQMCAPLDPSKITFEGKPVDIGLKATESTLDELLEEGFSDPRGWAEGCLGWIWCQWLARAPIESIRKEVEFVVERGLQVQELCKSQSYRALHDLWLLHCAIFGSSKGQLLELAKRVVDSKGVKKKPADDGELFAAAWCGMLKYRLLGDLEKSRHEAELIWKASRYDIVRAAPKPMVVSWLAPDETGFAKQQQKDFDSLWEWLRKNRIVLSESENETVIAFSKIPVPGRGWCWAHCGLAILAHREGTQVITDPFWFPPSALTAI